MPATTRTPRHVSSKVEQPGGALSSADAVKYAVALLCVIAGLFAFYWFPQWALALRLVAVIAGLAAGVAVFMLTLRGAHTREFLSEARFELRKVVWPTRQEALRQTWVVIVVVVLIALLLAGFDFFIQGGVKWLLAR
jgi:preprotein translocase subunit SecE